MKKSREINLGPPISPCKHGRWDGLCPVCPLEKERDEAQEGAEDYHAAWQDAAVYWLDKVAALKAERDQARRIAREWIDAYPWPGRASVFYWDGENFMCTHASGASPGCPGCLDGALQRCRKALRATESERDEARVAAEWIIKSAAEKFDAKLRDVVLPNWRSACPWLSNEDS